MVFGITGDLARVMTFRSLYRLELARPAGLPDRRRRRRRLDEWTSWCERARESIEGTGETIDQAVFDRFAARLYYVHGDFTDAATYQRVGSAIEGARVSRVLPGDPAVPVRHGRPGLWLRRT